MKNNIRIFLSSTFRDMQKERDYLVKKVFPALREIAEERGIPFSWCDLRFGVSSFEEENIIRLCLKNIEDGSPCFVGLLGENYGSIPHNLNKKQIKRLSVYHGVPTMIKRKYGYTEIEMRSLMSNKSSAIQYQIRETDKLNQVAFKDDLIALVKRAMDIESYLKNHELHQMFYERCNDYIDFEGLFINIGSILKL